MLRVQGLIPLIGAIATLCLAVFVYFRAPDKTLGRVFSFLAITLVFWNLNIFSLYAFHEYESALGFSRIFRTGSVFLLPAILHLSLVLPRRPLSRGWRLFLALDYGWSALLAGLNLSGKLVTHLAAFQWGYYSIGGPLYNLFTVSLIVNFLLAAWLLAREFVTTTEPHMRIQLKLWLGGMAVALPLGLTNLLPAYGVHFYPLGNLGSAIWAGVVAYAIVRYRLMDIEIVVARSISYLLTTIVCIGPTSLAVWLLQIWAFGEVHYDFSAAVAIIILIVALVFPRLQQSVEQGLERSLFPAKVQSHAVLGALANEVVRELDRGRLSGLVCERVALALELDRIALYVRDDASGSYDLCRSIGPDIRVQSFPVGDPVVRWVLSRGEAVLREEAADSKSGSSDAAARLRVDSWEVCVPFVVGREMQGLLLLDRKRGLNAYSTRDLNLLAIVGREVGVALQNSKLYEELRKSREIISRAGRLSALGTLAAGIAHEIRNPLVSIQTFFQLAPQRLGDEEFMTSFLGLAGTEVKRITGLIAELLTFAKSPSPSFGPINVNEISDRAVTLLKPQAHSEGVNLSSRLGASVSYVQGDADQIMQVVLNLALNAIQATPKGGSVTVTTREAPAAPSKFTQIEISDTGCGIPPESLECIFDPFFTTKEKGTGLGLSIAQQIVSESGGFLEVESSVGLGTRVVVNVPSVASLDGTEWQTSESRSA